MSAWNHAKKWTLHLDGISLEVCTHSEREPDDLYSFPRAWNTYLHFGDFRRYSKDGQLCSPYAEPHPWVAYLWENRSALDGLEGWNGGPTFAEFLTDELGIRRIKIGDDYQHLWDGENRRFEMYDLEYMQRQITRTAEEAQELLRMLVK